MKKDSLIAKAVDFAVVAHKGQKRKYTGQDYIVHPINVMNLVSRVSHTTEMLVAALLHDVVEDTPISIDEIQREFGIGVALLVDWLTDKSTKADGNRETRKKLDRERLFDAPADAQTIKVADLIDNSKSIIAHDPNFAKVYIREKKLLLSGLTQADVGLSRVAYKIVEHYENRNYIGV